jgi:hypothetical protein
MPGGRELKYSATIAQQNAETVHVTTSPGKADFVSNKQAADEKKAAPRLLFQSVQVNIDAGRLPEPHGNKIRYLKIPINIFPPKHLLSDKDKKQISADEVTGFKAT